MKTTVIIPTHNRAGSLVHAIQSLLAQADDVDLDILVVNDGSTDGTVESLEVLSRADRRLRHVSQVQSGVAAARNKGLEHLLDETELVTFLDSDDISPAGRFADDLPILFGQRDLDYTYGRKMFIDKLDTTTLVPTPNCRKVEATAIHLSCGLFRRSLIERVGVFDLQMVQGEDTDYLFRIFEGGTPFRQTETLCLYHLRHAGNMSGNIETMNRYFALALRKSILRRRNNPAVTFVKPEFSFEGPRGTVFQ